MSYNSWREILWGLLEAHLIEKGHSELLPVMTLQRGVKSREGVYVSNLGFLLAGKWACPPQQAAETFVNALITTEDFSRWECEAVNGFINCKPSQLNQLLRLKDGFIASGQRELLQTGDERADYAMYRLAFLQKALALRGIEPSAQSLDQVALILEGPCFSGLKDWIFEPGSDQGSKAFVDWLFELNRKQDLSQWDLESLGVLALLLSWAEPLGLEVK